MQRSGIRVLNLAVGNQDSAALIRATALTYAQVNKFEQAAAERISELDVATPDP